jgi:hypothetical protein
MNAGVLLTKAAPSTGADRERQVARVAPRRVSRRLISRVKYYFG